jgi:hypothetical protein
MFSILRRYSVGSIVRRNFANSPGASVNPAKKEVTQKTRRQNLAVAFLIVSFVGGVYYTSISKLKQTVSVTTFVSYRVVIFAHFYFETFLLQDELDRLIAADKKNNQ